MEPEIKQRLEENLGSAREEVKRASEKLQEIKRKLASGKLADSPAVIGAVSDAWDAIASGDKGRASAAIARCLAHIESLEAYGVDKPIHIIEREDKEGIPFPREWSLGISIPSSYPTVIGGFPGHGKTTTVLNLLLELVQKKKRSLFVSLEMRKTPVARKLAIMDQMIALENESMDWDQSAAFIKSSAGKERLEKISEFFRMKDVGPSASFTVSNLFATVDSYVRSGFAPQVIVLDYFQALEHNGEENKDLARSMKQITRFCEQVQIPFILLSQLARTSYKEYGAATLASYQGTSQIEKDAGLAINTARIIGPKDGPYDATILRVVKNRLGGSQFAVACKLHRQTQTIIGTIGMDEVVEWIKEHKKSHV